MYWFKGSSMSNRKGWEIEKKKINDQQLDPSKAKS